jgi:hypothetical protein
VARIFITNHRPLRITFRTSSMTPDLLLEQSYGRAYPRSSKSLGKIEDGIRDLSLMKV